MFYVLDKEPLGFDTSNPEKVPYYAQRLRLLCILKQVRAAGLHGRTRAVTDYVFSLMDYYETVDPELWAACYNINSQERYYR